MTRHPEAAELIRKAWTDASQFHEISEKEVLERVAKRVSEVKGNPVVLLDLDSTLYEVGPRTIKILEEWLVEEKSRIPESIQKAFKNFSLAHIGYSVRDTFTALGIELSGPASSEAQAALESAKKFWGDRFFSSAYLQWDRPYPGAVSFTKKLHEIGAKIIYLTGRDEPGMGDGTRTNLIRDEFPWEKPGTHLLLKKSADLSDLDHKRDAAHEIRKQGELVASFENEPKNLVALYELFPDAMHVFLETICSDHGARACKGLYRIKGFEHSRS
jgi:hypothetical protein